MRNLSFREMNMMTGKMEWISNSHIIDHWGKSLVPTEVLVVPVVSECISRRLFPAFVGLRIQQAVVSMDGMAEVIPSILLTCQETSMEENEQRKHRNSQQKIGHCHCLFLFLASFTNVVKRKAEKNK